MEDQKFTKKSVSFPDSLLQAGEMQAKRLHAGNFSRYIQTLIERDLAQNYSDPEVASEVIVNLARAFHPTLEKALAEQIFALEPPTTNNPVQPRIIARFLLALHEAMKRDDFDPRMGFQLWSSEYVLMNSILGNPALKKYLQTGITPFSKAAERPQSDYGGPEEPPPIGTVAKKKTPPPAGKPGATAHLPKPGEKPGDAGSAASA